jgi:hypothetical protein
MYGYAEPLGVLFTVVRAACQGQHAQKLNFFVKALFSHEHSLLVIPSLYQDEWLVSF